VTGSLSQEFEAVGRARSNRTEDTYAALAQEFASYPLGDLKLEGMGAVQVVAVTGRRGAA
jgi:hypothetical protein